MGTELKINLKIGYLCIKNKTIHFLDYYDYMQELKEITSIKTKCESKMEIRSESFHKRLELEEKPITKRFANSV